MFIERAGKDFFSLRLSETLKSASPTIAENIARRWSERNGTVALGSRIQQEPI
jgi:hypothetical protein